MLGKPSWSRNSHEHQQGIKEDRRAEQPPERKEHNPMWPADKPVALPQSQGRTSKENQELADEVYIPDYVMLDFGTSKTTSTEGKPLQV